MTDYKTVYRLVLKYKRDINYRDGIYGSGTNIAYSIGTGNHIYPRRPTFYQDKSLQKRYEEFVNQYDEDRHYFGFKTVHRMFKWFDLLGKDKITEPRLDMDEHSEGGEYGVNYILLRVKVKQIISGSKQDMFFERDVLGVEPVTWKEVVQLRQKWEGKLC